MNKKEKSMILSALEEKLIADLIKEFGTDDPDNLSDAVAYEMSAQPSSEIGQLVALTYSDAKAPDEYADLTYEALCLYHGQHYNGNDD